MTVVPEGCRVLREQPGAWSGLVLRYRERKGGRSFTWAKKTGRTWIGRLVWRGVEAAGLFCRG